jgi:phosphoglycolate phosphatase
MHFEGLIFDLDGTLWDCSKASAHAFNLAYEKFGIDRRVSADFVKSISGKPSSECDEILLSGIPDSIRKDVSQCFDELEIAAVQEYAPNSLYPEVILGLETLKLDYKLLVVSNCGERYLEVFLRHTSIGTLFTDSECFGRTRKLKHENIRAIIERQKLLSPCYVGDTAGDEEAAAKAGVPFFHASYGFGVPVGRPVGFASFGELTRYFCQLAGET